VEIAVTLKFDKGIIFWYVTLIGFCGLEVPKFAGSNLAEAVGFLRAKNPQHAFLRRESKAVRPMSQICGI
jgi:hypothetical protein